ncbi:MAG: hypothetical protein L0J48_00925 [Alkalibacterium sp.]|nr:hypothetical protein [Alkalibacterium sp.]
MKKLATIFFAVSFLAFGTFASGESIVSDSFESGNLSAPGAPGFEWANNTGIAIVTPTTLVFETAPRNEPAPPNSQWEAKSGEHALRFFYPADKHWIEQRFSFDPQPEIWMSFWLRVPTNFAHPSLKGAADNQKLFTLWMDGYSSKGEGSTIGVEFRPSGGGSSYFYGKVSRGDYNVAGSDQGRVQFIQVPRDRGRWMHLVVHVASERTPGAKNGMLQLWRKWKGDSNYTKTHDLKNQPIKLSPRVKGFSHGYLMGWANAAYPVDTEFLIDDFKLSTSPLFINSGNPKPPSGIIVE